MIIISLESSRTYRMTHQRKVILEEVQKNHQHPSADEIYERVRKRLPKISMGTVYRNLDILASCGLIKKIEPDYPQMRFDGKTHEHYHIVCMECGKVKDVPIQPTDDNLKTLESALGKLTKYGIFGHKLEFVGLCEGCLEKDPSLIQEKGPETLVMKDDNEEKVGREEVPGTTKGVENE